MRPIKRPQVLSVALAFTTFLFFTQCNTDELDFDNINLPHYEATHYLPLGSSTFGVAELLEDLEDDKLDIDTTQAGILTLVYRDTTEFTDISEVVEVNDVSNDGLIDPSIEIVNSPIEQEVDFSQDLSFEYPISEGDELDSIIYNLGNITITYESDFDVELSFEMVIDDIINRATGEPLVLSGTAPANSGGSQTESLSNHRTIATRNGSGENVFTGVFNGTLHLSTGDDVFVTDQFRYRIDIVDVEYQTIYGYFGEKTYEIQSEEIEMDFFEEFDGNLNFGDPEIRMIIDNSFGVTMGLELSNVFSSNKNGERVSLTGSVTESLQFINAPGVTSVGSSSTSTIRINNDNSNLGELLNIVPNVLGFSVSAQSNFTNTNSVVPEEDRNFVDISSMATTIVEVEIPLDLQLTHLSRTLDYSLEDFDFDNADSLNLRIKTINMMPINGSIDLQILDADSAVVHEIRDVSVFNSPVVPTGSKITEGAESIDYIKFFGEGLEALTTQPTIRLVINVESYDSEEETFVKIYSDYNLEILLGVEATLNLEIN